MTNTEHPPQNLARRIFSTPPAKILLLGFIFVMMKGLNSDVMTSYAAEPGKSLQHIIALAIAGIAVYVAYARFVEQRPVTELSL